MIADNAINRQWKDMLYERQRVLTHWAWRKCMAFCRGPSPIQLSEENIVVSSRFNIFIAVRLIYSRTSAYIATVSFFIVSNFE